MEQILKRYAILAACFLCVVTGCGMFCKEKKQPLIWHTESPEGYIQSLLTINIGPVPMADKLHVYDFIGGHATNGNWAFMATNVMEEISNKTENDLKGYAPVQNRSGRLIFQRVLFGHKVIVETMRISEHDPLYARSFQESRDRLCSRFNYLVKAGPINHCLYVLIFRLRYEQGVVYLDVGPYTSENYYTNFDTFVFIRPGFRYRNESLIYYSPEVLRDFPAGNREWVHAFNDTLQLQGQGCSEPVAFQYVSLPYPVVIKEGTPRCAVQGNRIRINRDPGKGIVLVADILIKYRDYARSGELDRVADDWIKEHRRRSSIKDLSAPLVELHLESPVIE